MGFENRLTEGSVIKQLIKFSLPLLLSNIVQALYSVADMLIVGWFSGTYTMSAVI
jgi:Na+-driven multidrug efflux pump